MSSEIAINLGLDFGTRFTKICARSDEVGVCVVDFENSGLNGALTPSIVSVNGNGLLSVPNAGSIGPQDQCIVYLKMALSERGKLGIHADPAMLDGLSEELVEPLAAIFLATVIKRAKDWVKSTWSEHIGEREVVWSANVGLPVEYVDSDVAPRFQEVISVAWDWSEAGVPKGRASRVAELYAKSSARKDPGMSFCQTYPEIAAAVLSFATSRSAAPGIYVYFDAGGGTLDGVVFNLLRPDGEVRINFYSGHVESLGVDWVAEDVCRCLFERTGETQDPEAVKRLLLQVDSAEVDEAFASYSGKISNFVGKTVYQGKRKDGRNWRKQQIQTSSAHRTLRSHLFDENLNPLRVFVGGGGSGAPFYQKSISKGYERNGLKNFGVPPFELVQVPAPPDLLMGSVDLSEYHRFLIAYGLSVPFGEGPDIGLPSQLPEAPPMKATRTGGLPDYGDHKDIYD
jgi:hypothetical protein